MWMSQQHKLLGATDGSKISTKFSKFCPWFQKKLAKLRDSSVDKSNVKAGETFVDLGSAEDVHRCVVKPDCRRFSFSFISCSFLVFVYRLLVSRFRLSVARFSFSCVGNHIVEAWCLQ